MNAQRPQFSFEPDADGEIARHDMPCPVCASATATFLPATGIFVPCMNCLADGWELVRWRTWLGRWRARYRSYRPHDYRRPHRRRASGEGMNNSLRRRVR